MKENNKGNKTLVIRIDGGLGRVIAMSGAITEKAKLQPVKVITSRPLVFWGNPYIESVHGLDDRDLFRSVIKGNDYIEIEPYTDPRFFNDGVNWLDIVREKLGLEQVAEPALFLAEHEKIQYRLGDDFNSSCCRKKILFQPFGSSVSDTVGADRSYRSLYVKDAQYIADRLIENGYEVYVVERQEQPKLRGCISLTTNDLRFVVGLCNSYPVLGIDSCLHHASKAFGKQAIVIWAGTDKERFGYESHINLREHPMVAHTPMRLPMNSFDFDISNQYTNKFSKEFLDSVIDMVLKTF